MAESTDVDAQVQLYMAATGLDEDSVRKMLQALDQQRGEDVGTLRRDPVSGAYAHRVMDGDVAKWRISHPTDGMTYEMAAAKPTWQLVNPPTGPA